MAIGVIVLAFFVVVGIVVHRERLGGDVEASRFRGTYLGMTAPEVRQRFAAGAPGHWAASTSQVGEEALLWTADGAAAPIAHAAFEFHDRILVAVRAELASDTPEASGPPRMVTPVAVRALADDRSDAPTVGRDAPRSLTILARDCPTHASEVARLLATGS